MFASRKLIVLAVLWSVGIAGGLHLLMTYKAKSGARAETPAVWPDNHLIPSPSSKPLLVMFAHPRCPCTKASLGELELLTARAKDKLEATVLFYEPEDGTDAWTNTTSIDVARAIPGVQVIADKSGKVARRFRAETSGHTVVYGANGKLLFSGGITGSRGHMGDNHGLDSVLNIVNGDLTAVSRKTTEVFGCELFDQCTNLQTSLKH